MRSSKLALANILVAAGAFGVAAMMAVMQALSRASVTLPERTPKIFYLSVTAHGVLMALVFTTFFIMSFGYVIARHALGRETPWQRFAWASFWVSLVGTLMATVAILSGKASVLYTFYPPLKATPAFYIGAALLVIGSWGWSAIMLASWRAFRREHPAEPTPLALHGMIATVVVWLLCTPGIATEVVVQLIPWSLGWVDTVDPILARTLFWYTGHPLVYFWLLPAYVAWYAILPKAVGGKLFSDRLGRAVFVMFIVLSTPVGFHHQFMDPGIEARWKLLHAVATFAILFPSLVTAFTITASIEVGARARGGKGLLRWVGALPWGEPLFTSVVLSMLVFAIGGWGGAVNAAYGMNAVVHNTAWIQGHFHLTVGTASALTFMGVTYWLLPRLTGKETRFQAFAQVQPWLWFAGMMLFSVSNHVTGILGMPRRVYEATYAGAEAAKSWAPWTAVSAAGGVILFVSAMCFVLVVFGTMLWGKPLPQPPEVELSEAIDPPTAPGAWDRIGRWTVVAIVLIVLAYAWPLWQLLSMDRFGSPPWVTF